jgi:hypothetical protein
MQVIALTLKEQINHLARLVLSAFLLTFILARMVVFGIMSRRLPDLFLHLGGTHIHHLNYGIFLLAGVGAYLLFCRPTGRHVEITALLYGIGMALTFDEFGMWIHLGGSYWQRASWDAITVLAAVFSLLAFAPALSRFRPSHWATGILTVIVLGIFFWMLAESFEYVGQHVGPTLHKIEATSPP